MALTISTLRDCKKRQEEYVFQLATWHHNEWLHLNPGATLEERTARYKKSVLTQSLPEIMIACEGDKLLGSVTLDKEDMDTRKFLTPWLASLFVEPDNRGRGIASALIKFCVNYAKQQGFKNLYLFTEDQRDFYQHRGWHFVEALEYRNAEVDLMSQKLK